MKSREEDPEPIPRLHTTSPPPATSCCLLATGARPPRRRALLHGHDLDHLVSYRLHPDRVAIGLRLLARTLAIGSEHSPVICLEFTELLRCAA